MSKRRSENPVRLKRNTNIGSAAAETDPFLIEYECFVDTGDLPALRDCQNPQSIVLGRTGSGKSALLRELAEKEEHVVELAPEVLSLSYISNSRIIEFFEEIGVKLNIFYALLWRHVLTVELLKLKYEIYNESKKKTFLEKLGDIFARDQSKQKALAYLEDWGEKFWENTEYRVKELTSKLESELTAKVGIETNLVSAGAAGAHRLTQEQKSDVVSRAQSVVNQIQIKQLHDVIRLLEEDIFVNDMQHYFVVIDRLDEDWADEKIRYHLIRALIETIKTFHKVKGVKIVVALRTDLYMRILREVPRAGFQEEKYESLFLRLVSSPFLRPI